MTKQSELRGGVTRRGRETGPRCCGVALSGRSCRSVESRGNANLGMVRGRGKVRRIRVTAQTAPKGDAVLPSRRGGRCGTSSLAAISSCNVRTATRGRSPRGSRTSRRPDAGERNVMALMLLLLEAARRMILLVVQVSSCGVVGRPSPYRWVSNKTTCRRGLCGGSGSGGGVPGDGEQRWR